MNEKNVYPTESAARSTEQNICPTESIASQSDRAECTSHGVLRKVERLMGKFVPLSLQKCWVTEPPARETEKDMHPGVLPAGLSKCIELTSLWASTKFD